MKKIFSARGRSYTVAAGMMLLFLQNLTSIGAPRLSSEEGVFIPYDEAARMAEVLEKMLARAPRFDEPNIGDPEFPPLQIDDFETLSRAVCLINEQLEDCCSIIEDCCSIIEDCCSTLDDCCSTIDECCSTIDHIDDVVGDVCDSAIDFADCVTEEEIDATKATVISWLKTIMRDLRGLVNGSACDQISNNT